MGTLLLCVGDAAVGGSEDVGLSLVGRRRRWVGAVHDDRLERVELGSLAGDRAVVGDLARREEVRDPESPVTAVPDPGAPDLDAIVLRRPCPGGDGLALPLG